MTRGNDLDGKHDEWKFTELNIVWVGTIVNVIFWIGIIRVGISWVVIILDGSFLALYCPGDSYPGWEFSVWELPGWKLSWLGIFLGGIFRGGNCPVGIIRSNFPGGTFPSN